MFGSRYFWPISDHCYVSTPPHFLVLFTVLRHTTAMFSLAGLRDWTSPVSPPPPECHGWNCQSGELFRTFEATFNCFPSVFLTHFSAMQPRDNRYVILRQAKYTWTVMQICSNQLFTSISPSTGRYHPSLFCTSRNPNRGASLLPNRSEDTLSVKR